MSVITVAEWKTRFTLKNLLKKLKKKLERKLFNKPKIIVILGPTASGKSELAVQLAKRFNGEIISADSRQVYKGLDIGSGKVPRDSIFGKSDFPKINRQYKEVGLPYIYKGVIHHLLDVASPKKTFTVVQYQKLAKKALNDIIRRGKLPIICGGTGLYIDSVIYGIKFPEVPPQPKLRKQLEQKTTEELYKQLKKLDPKRAENIDRHNRRRLIRAIEIAKTLGKTPKIKKTSPYDVLKICVSVPKEKLKEKINRRVDKMFKLGLIDETKKLLKKYPADLPAFNTIGYREIIDYLKDKTTLPEAISLIKKNTWQYSKRQTTWFKRDKEIHWIKNKGEAFRLLRGYLAD